MKKVLSVVILIIIGLGVYYFTADRQSTDSQIKDPQQFQVKISDQK